MAIIKRVLTVDLFNEYVLEQIKPYIDTKSAASIEVFQQGDTGEAVIALYNRENEKISEATIDLPDEKIPVAAHLDLENRKLVFECNDGSTFECNIVELVDDYLTKISSTAETLGLEINQEKIRAQSSEQALDIKITTETNRAIAAESQLNTKVDAEVTRATTKEAELEAAISGAGKIDDVKVDGVSVVENKVANISTVDSLSSLPGYDATKSQVLRHGESGLFWEETLNIIKLDD